MPSSKYGIAALLVLAVAVAGGWLLGRGGSGEPRPRRSAPEAGSAEADPKAAVAPTIRQVRTRATRGTAVASAGVGPSRGLAPGSRRAESESAERPMAGPLPASLQHVPVPGDLHVGQDGRFEPTAEAIQLFDHFLQARSEAPLNVLYDRTVAEIQARLPPDAADQAVHLLERYIVYRRGVAKSLETTVGGWKVSPLDVLAARQRLQFGDDLSERLFGEQARRDREAFRQSLKLGDPGPRSHPGEGPAAPATGRPADSAPGDDAPEFAALHLLPLRIQEQELRDRGGGAEEVRALREKLVGPDVADRLDALDRQKADWRQRVALYRAERGEIERLAGADAEQRRFLIEQLQVEHFAPDELLRIELLDRVDLPPALWKP